ncbi:molybdopterin molybdotransferase MoeA [Methanocaldococcus infernus]
MLIKSVISYKEALEIVKKHFKPNISEVSLINSLNKICGEDIKALISLPYFKSSAMDGYAVRAEDVRGASETNPIILRLVDKEEIDEGEAKKVFTGSPLPENADSVVMKEFCREDNELVEVYKTVFKGENVREIGEDVKKGELILKKGDKIRGFHLALLSSLGVRKVKVYDLTFGIINTGDELIELEEFNINKLNHKIVNSNLFLLSGLINELGFNYKYYGIVKDDPEKLKDVIKKAIDEVDSLIITGGTSVGERDYSVKVAKELGTLLIHGVNIRPGKPFAFSLIKNKPVFLLSGYPVALLTQFELFIYRLITKRKKVKLPLSRGVASELGRLDLLRVKVYDKVEPLRIGGSGIISSLIKSDGYLLIPENVEGYEKEEEVEVYLW